MITLAQLTQIIKFKNDDIALSWFVPLTYFLPKYQITTVIRIAAFLAQTAHESNGYTAVEENLNYSAEGLTKTFKKYFPTTESTVGYARNPPAIANKVYANRMGNGDEESQDGWAYRGRGLIQLTGANNYTAFGAVINKLPKDVIAYMSTKEGAVHSACWFWDTNKLNTYADVGDITGMTKRINGGQTGLDDRIARYNKAVQVLSVQN